MARAPRSASQPPPESLTATVRLRGQEFSFKLFTRPLRLGDYGTVQYYWMDSSQLRAALATEAAAANFRACVGHWWAAMLVSGLGDDPDQQAHLVSALCYPLVSRDKSLQAIYRDAHLDPKRLRSASASLPDDLRLRIREVVRGRDRLGVQREL